MEPTTTITHTLSEEGLKVRVENIVKALRFRGIATSVEGNQINVLNVDIKLSRIVRALENYLMDEFIAQLSIVPSKLDGCTWTIVHPTTITI
jgi:hypothetical protein